MFGGNRVDHDCRVVADKALVRVGAGDIMGVAPTLIMSQLAQAKLHFASLADDHPHRF